MYKNVFGKNRQVCFFNDSDYYQLIGYLARGNGATKLVWEDNDEQGAWAKEGRILFYVPPPKVLRAKLIYTKGVGGILKRVNCNEFVRHIIDHHQFNLGIQQNTDAIRSSVPQTFQVDFDDGLCL